MHDREPTKVAILVFDRFTALDAVGPFEVLARIPGVEVAFVAKAAGPVRSAMPAALTLQVDVPLEGCPRPDVVVVAGGPGATEAGHDTSTQDWLRACHATSRFTTSVCTGALVLGAAGILRGLRATTHWLARSQLEGYGATVVNERVVVEGRVVTAAGVSAGLDMALRLAQLMAGDQVAQAIQLGLEYDPEPPFACGSPSRAPAALVEHVRARARGARR